MGRRKGEPLEPVDRAAMMRRMLRAYGESVSDPADLADLVELRAHVDAATDVAVATMRRIGFSNGEIGAALGMTRQGVRQRWPVAGKSSA